MPHRESITQRSRGGIATGGESQHRETVCDGDGNALLFLRIRLVVRNQPAAGFGSVTLDHDRSRLRDRIPVQARDRRRGRDRGDTARIAFGGL